MIFQKATSKLTKINLKVSTYSLHNKKIKKIHILNMMHDEFHSQQKVSESWCSAFVIFLVSFWVWLIVTPFLCKLQAQKLQCLEALPIYHQFFTELLLIAT